MSIRVFIVDNHGVLREGVRLLLDGTPDVRVVGMAETADSVIPLLQAAKPELILMDLSMPGINGFEAIERLRRDLPELKILVLTRHAEGEYARRAMAAGASAYVLKQSSPARLLEAIRAVARDEVWVDPRVASKLGRVDASPRIPGEHPLTRREQEVVTLIALGHTNKEIGNQLGISVKTVETHKTNVMHKLGVHRRADLVRFALEQGWLR